ncbi:hypothetical protein HUJ05_001413 [Dendroctonus ponderosae]|nr:hypothetical protein HUJ05_001413 [Dendroctonus ponderosae]
MSMFSGALVLLQRCNGFPNAKHGGVRKENYYEPDDEIPLNEWVEKYKDSDYEYDTDEDVPMLSCSSEQVKTKLSDFNFFEYVSIDNGILTRKMLSDEQVIDSVTSSTALSDNEKDDDLGESPAQLSFTCVRLSLHRFLGAQRLFVPMGTCRERLSQVFGDDEFLTSFLKNSLIVECTTLLTASNSWLKSQANPVFGLSQPSPNRHFNRRLAFTLPTLTVLYICPDQEKGTTLEVDQKRGPGRFLETEVMTKRRNPVLMRKMESGGAWRSQLPALKRDQSDQTLTWVIKNQYPLIIEVELSGSICFQSLLESMILVLFYLLHVIIGWEDFEMRRILRQSTTIFEMFLTGGWQEKIDDLNGLAGGYMNTRMCGLPRLSSAKALALICFVFITGK